MQAAFEVTYSQNDGFNGIVYTIGTNWVQYKGKRITCVGYNPVRYDDATGRITRIGDNLVMYGKDGKITQIGRNIVVYSGDKVHTIGNKWVQYASNQSGGK